MEQVCGICTLFEGDYHLGLAAFVNSLHDAGYSGPVWAGYRGALPPWVNQLGKTADPRTYRVGDRVWLTFVPLETEMHFANYKPQFMLDLLAGPASGCNYLWYFDPDLYFNAKWTFFADWQRHGIALCQEIVDNILPEDAPLRHKWMEVGEVLGLGSPRPLNYYYNGGMVGVPAAQSGFLKLWARVIEYAGTIGDVRQFTQATREHPFHSIDQDALNAAAMYSQHPLTTLGPQGMGFIPGTAVVYHSVGPKPWRARFLRRALGGVPPSPADKFFFAKAAAPILLYSPLRLALFRASFSLAAFIGRFYHRN